MTPYVMDLGSANGTYVNNNRIESQKYVQLLEKVTCVLSRSVSLCPSLSLSLTLFLFLSYTISESFFFSLSVASYATLELGYLALEPEGGYIRSTPSNHGGNLRGDPAFRGTCLYGGGGTLISLSFIYLCH